MQCSKYLTKLEHPDTMQKFIMKLPFNLRKAWRRSVRHKVRQKAQEWTKGQAEQKREILKHVQTTAFSEEFNHPIVIDGLLHVGGRLRKVSLPTDQSTSTRLFFRKKITLPEWLSTITKGHKATPVGSEKCEKCSRKVCQLPSSPGTNRRWPIYQKVACLARSHLLHQ